MESNPPPPPKFCFGSSAFCFELDIARDVRTKKNKFRKYLLFCLGLCSL